MSDRSQWFILTLLVVFSFSMQSKASAFVITSQDWARPRSAAHLLRFPPLAQAVGQLRVHPDARLLIHYPGGDEGMLWVHELQSWLVALGVSSEEIELVPGSSKQTVIEIEVVFRNGKSVSEAAIETAEKQKNDRHKVNP